MTVVKELVVQIQLDTNKFGIREYWPFSPSFWHSFQFCAANCCLFIKFILSLLSKFCQKI